MKAPIVAATLLVFGAGCTARQGEELSQRETDRIRSEVAAVGDTIMARFVRLDGTGAFQLYADTPHWVMFNADGSQWSYETTRKAMDDSTRSSASYEYRTLRRDFMVVNRDVVVCAWVLKDEVIIASGDTIVYNQHPYTLVFRRIGGQWKVVWSHDSGVPMRLKAGAAHRH
jgi:SnoaL-like protein